MDLADSAGGSGKRLDPGGDGRNPALYHNVLGNAQETAGDRVKKARFISDIELSCDETVLRRFSENTIRL